MRDCEQIKVELAIFFGFNISNIKMGNIAELYFKDPELFYEFAFVGLIPYPGFWLMRAHRLVLIVRDVVRKAWSFDLASGISTSIEHDDSFPGEAKDLVNIRKMFYSLTERLTEKNKYISAAETEFKFGHLTGSR